MMEARARDEDWAVEAEVLSEAAATLGEWAKRLPTGSDWCDVFAGLSGDVDAWLELRRLCRDRAA